MPHPYRASTWFAFRPSVNAIAATVLTVASSSAPVVSDDQPSSL